MSEDFEFDWFKHRGTWQQKGGEGSGHHGHAGVPGQLGGSAPGGAGAGGPAGGGKAGWSSLGDGSLDKKSHTQVANMISKEAGGLKKRGPSEKWRTTISGPVGKRKKVESVLKKQGFEREKEEKGVATWRNGKFVASLSEQATYLSGKVVNVFITDLVGKLGEPLWHGQD